MTLDEAIKVLDRITAQDEESGRPECVEAEKLGIEALKQIKANRPGALTLPELLLPGETTDRLTHQEQSLKRGNAILALGRKMIKETDELLGKPRSPL